MNCFTSTIHLRSGSLSLSPSLPSRFCLTLFCVRLLRMLKIPAKTYWHCILAWLFLHLVNILPATQSHIFLSLSLPLTSFPILLSYFFVGRKQFQKRRIGMKTRIGKIEKQRRGRAEKVWNLTAIRMYSLSQNTHLCSLSIRIALDRWATLLLSCAWARHSLSGLFRCFFSLSLPLPCVWSVKQFWKLEKWSKANVCLFSSDFVLVKRIFWPFSLFSLFFYRDLF